MNPLILLMDEATSALDSKSEMYIQESFSQMKQGRTVIAVAHRLSTVRDMDNIVVMKSGRIIDQGRHEQLLETCEQYQELVRNEWVNKVEPAEPKDMAAAAI